MSTTVEDVHHIQLTADVAARLGDDWRAGEDVHGRPRIYHRTLPVYIVLALGGFASVPKGKVRATVYCEIDNTSYWADDLRHEDGYKPLDLTANMSEAKTPAVMAADITRRLVPSAELFAQLAQTRHDRQVAYATTSLDNLHRVAAALGGEVREHAGNRSNVLEFRKCYDVQHDYHTDKSVRLLLDLRPDEWEALAPLLKPMIEARR